MLPKVKPLPKKPTKKESEAAAAMPPPAAAAAAAAAATSFSVNAEDPLTAHYYYADRVYDYTSVVFRVNGMMQKGEYQVRVAKDGLGLVRLCNLLEVLR